MKSQRGDCPVISGFLVEVDKSSLLNHPNDSAGYDFFIIISLLFSGGRRRRRRRGRRQALQDCSACDSAIILLIAETLFAS